MCKIKKKKAAGIDSVPMEAWIYVGKDLRKRLVELLYKIYTKSVEYRQDAARLEGKYNCPSIQKRRRGESNKLQEYLVTMYGV